jgi:hypothetical protein
LGITVVLFFASDFLDDWFLHDSVIISENGFEDLISDHPPVVVTEGKQEGRRMLLQF